MQIGELKSAKRQERKRVGRGPGSGTGKTAGRGENGQGSRSGFSKRPWFEGGQMPLQRRLPKRGFKPINRVEYQIVNVAHLEQRFDNNALINPDALIAKGLIRNNKSPVKILGDGELTKTFTIEADKFTKTAEQKITQAGGQAAVKQTVSATVTD